MIYNKKVVEFLREQFPQESRIKLNKMESDPYPVKPGSEGILRYIDDAGQFHVSWDCGSSLALVLGVDSFKVLPPKPTDFNLYMPLSAHFAPYRYAELQKASKEIIIRYSHEIKRAMNKTFLEPEMIETGLMHWYDEEDGVKSKVHSLFFSIEHRDNQFYGVAKCSVIGQLSDLEIEALKRYISGQASDGWGESFEQQNVLENSGSEESLYVHLWNSENWFIKTETELFGVKKEK